MLRVFALFVVGGLARTAASAEPQWVSRYFFDRADSTLTITDLKFPSPRRGIAGGVIERKRSAAVALIGGDREKLVPVVLITNDAGDNWTEVQVKEVPLSLFFLDDSIGWMVTMSGIWMTEESGRSWKRLASLKGMREVFFTSRERGFAVGSEKRALRTVDGGATWTPIAEAAKPETTVAWTVYNTITFSTSKTGFISGWSRRPMQGDFDGPSWRYPEEQTKRPQTPNVTIFLETRDGGETWKWTSSSLFGEMTHVSLIGENAGLGLFEFHASFPWPSEVYRIDLNNGSSVRTFREKKRAISDVLLTSEGPAYLAGYEPVGTLWPSPVPGKLHILTSDDLKTWSEMKVDYRAVARRVFLASAGNYDLWAATDTGMILKLQDR